MAEIVSEFSKPILPWKHEDRQVWAARRIQQDVIHGRPLRIDADGLKALRAGRIGILPPDSRRPQSYTVLWMERLSRQIERSKKPFTRTELLGDHDTKGVNKEAFRLLLKHGFVEQLDTSKGVPRYRLVKKYRAVPAYSPGRNQKDWWTVIDPTVEDARFHTPPLKTIGDRVEAARRHRAEKGESSEDRLEAMGANSRTHDDIARIKCNSAQGIASADAQNSHASYLSSQRDHCLCGSSQLMRRRWRR